LNDQTTTEKKDHRPLSQCLNCSTPLEVDQYYCYTCGQKNKSSTVTLWSLISDLFSSIFNLDHGVWKSLIGVLRPAYLTRQFIKGRRKSYLNPLRLFFVSMVIHLALISSLINTDFADDLANENAKSAVLSDIQKDFEVIPDFNDYFCTTDFDSLGKYVMHTRAAEDTLATNMAILGYIDFSKYSFSRKDIYELSSEEVLDKYEITGFDKRLIIGQYIKAHKDLKGAIRFAFGNFLWAIIATIFLQSLLMKLLYIRKKKFFVEHILLMFNIHSFSFIAVSIPLIIMAIFKNLDLSGITQLLVFASLIYGFSSFKVYYDQGWFKTILKTGFLGFTYILTMSLCLILVLFISALLF